MPALQVMHLPRDHTSGGAAGQHTPRTMAADNDLALVRIVEALSQGPFWLSTAVFVLEDDRGDDGPGVAVAVRLLRAALEAARGRQSEAQGHTDAESTVRRGATMRRYAVPVMLLTLAGCASSGGVLGPPHWNGPLPSRRNLRVAVEAAKARLVSAARSADSGAMAAGLVSDALLIAGGDTIRGATALQRYLERGRAAAPRGTLLFRDPVIDLCTDGALEVGSALVFLPQDTLSGGPTPQTPYAVRWVVDPAGVARISSIGFAATPAEQAPSIRRCEHTLDELRLWRRPLRLRIGTTLSTLKWQNFGGTLASRGYGRHPLGGRAVTKRFNQGAWLWAGATARIAGPVSVELLGGWRAYRTEVAGFRAADSSDILFTQTTSWAALSVDLQYRRLRLAAGPLAARSSWRLREQIWTFWNLYWWNDEPVAEERWSDWTIGTFVQASYGIPLIADRFFLDLSVQYRSAEARLRGTPRFPPSRLALRSTTAGIVMGIAL